MKKYIFLISTLIIVLIMLASCNTVEFDYDDFEYYTKGQAEIDKKITKIEIDWIDGNISIKRSSEAKKVSFTENSISKSSEDNSLYYFVQGTTLNIKAGKSGRLDPSDYNKNLNVILPIDTVLNDIEIETVSSNVTIFDTEVKNIDVNTVSGNIDIKAYGDIDSVSVENVSGTTKLIANKIGDFEADVVSGNIEIYAYDELKGCEISSVSANVNLYLLSNSRFTLKSSAVSGDLLCDFDGRRVDGNTLVVGTDARNIYEIDTVSGDLNIQRLDD